MFLVRCGLLPEGNLRYLVPENQSFEYTGTVAFECQEGHQLSDGQLNGTMECLKNKSWSGESTCEKSLVLASIL